MRRVQLVRGGKGGGRTWRGRRWAENVCGRHAGGALGSLLRGGNEQHDTAERVRRRLLPPRPLTCTPPPFLPYKVDTSRPSLRTNWTRREGACGPNLKKGEEGGARGAARHGAEASQLALRPGGRRAVRRGRRRAAEHGEHRRACGARGTGPPQNGTGAQGATGEPGGRGGHSAPREGRGMPRAFRARGGAACPLSTSGGTRLVRLVRGGGGGGGGCTQRVPVEGRSDQGDGERVEGRRAARLERHERRGRCGGTRAVTRSGAGGCRAARGACRPGWPGVGAAAACLGSARR